MNYKIKYKLTADQADKLIEKYYEGFTSVEEERQLKAFLAQTGLPERFKAEQAIFGYFETKQSKPLFNLRSYIRWVGAIAAMFIIGFGIQTFTMYTSSDYAYVDGVKITNKSKIKTQALASLSNVAADNNEVEQSLENLNDNELMKQQLEVFSGLSK